jgi:quercetin dioxygenase-like cupin family protein
MSWKELEHPEPGVSLVEFANGTKLNINYGHVIDHHDPDYKRPTPAVSDEVPTITPVSMLYKFKKGAVLSEHQHDKATLHDIQVIKGRVLVRRESGDVELVRGDVVDIAEGEKHSIEALEPSVTLHTLLSVYEE